jgi:hypothetical protein
MKKFLSLGVLASATLATAFLAAAPATAAPADNGTYIGHYTTGRDCVVDGAWYVKHTSGATRYACPASQMGGNDLYLYFSS